MSEHYVFRAATTSSKIGSTNCLSLVRSGSRTSRLLSPFLPPFPSRSVPHRTSQPPARLDSSASSSLTPQRSRSPLLVSVSRLLICPEAMVLSQMPAVSFPLNLPVVLSSRRRHPQRPSLRRFHPLRTSKSRSYPCSIRLPANGDLASSIPPSSLDLPTLASGT